MIGDEERARRDRNLVLPKGGQRHFLPISLNAKMSAPLLSLSAKGDRVRFPGERARLVPGEPGEVTAEGKLLVCSIQQIPTTLLYTLTSSNHPPIPLTSSNHPPIPLTSSNHPPIHSHYSKNLTSLRTNATNGLFQAVHVSFQLGSLVGLLC
ncbi:hypothetical protein K504DRAFT_173205 [Pleomassaria siparia CBS 279.74]|uniref:Uncharacterized protein n=1 Tax=Pleomassaria siparia CBS 279.74 TaxID=1314801 RepID=A0A6G1JST5_9PLEO|nr:hypothetical protein K504DRAFT_173205 [Pleomassaria siparia CBS 279.74]